MIYAPPPAEQKANSRNAPSACQNKKMIKEIPHIIQRMASRKKRLIPPIGRASLRKAYFSHPAGNQATNEGESSFLESENAWRKIPKTRRKKYSAPPNKNEAHARRKRSAIDTSIYLPLAAKETATVAFFSLVIENCLYFTLDIYFAAIKKELCQMQICPLYR